MHGKNKSFFTFMKLKPPIGGGQVAFLVNESLNHSLNSLVTKLQCVAQRHVLLWLCLD